MSALLASASATFTYQGASVTLSCSSPIELMNALATFGIGLAANDTPAKPAAAPAPTAAPAAQAEGNAPAPTATPASAPVAAAGSAASGGDQPRPTYEEISKRVTALVKAKGRDVALGLLNQFTGQNGQPADHGTKLKLEDYPSFVAKADALLAGVAA